MRNGPDRKWLIAAKTCACIKAVLFTNFCCLFDSRNFKSSLTINFRIIYMIERKYFFICLIILFRYIWLIFCGRKYFLFLTNTSNMRGYTTCALDVSIHVRWNASSWAKNSEQNCELRLKVHESSWKWVNFIIIIRIWIDQRPKWWEETGLQRV